MRVVARWHELSGPAKFRLYSQVALQVAVVGVAVSMVISTPTLWAKAGIAVSGAAAVLALQAQPELAAVTSAALRRWVLPVASTILVVVWVTGAAVALLGAGEQAHEAAAATGIFAAMLAALSVFPFLRGTWWMVVAVSIATGAVFGTSPAAGIRTAALTLAIGVLLAATTLMTLWGLQIVNELERAKSVEARLQVAEERLRFSRDLHDVVGRGFSAIAVKSELAATLTRAGVADRAAAEMDEVKTLAVESMDQMRALVRGYREINLDGEVAGARSLLAAAGCELIIEGDPSRVPARFHDVAAWVVREATTNIVKHSSATSAILTLGAAGMSLRNNGVPEESRTRRDPGEETGLRGLAERLAHVGAEVESGVSGDRFALEINWEKK